MDRSEDDLSKDDIDLELELESDTSVAVVEDEVDKEELMDDSERSEESNSDSNYEGNNGNPFKVCLSKQISHKLYTFFFLCSLT